MPDRGNAPSPYLAWDADGRPRSTLFDDVYFSRDDGLAETEAVFMTGCGLPGAWAGRRRFCIAELGFGTGLNIAALLTLWRRTGPPGAHLSIFSVEAHPLTAAEAARALGRWREIAEAAHALTAAWPGRARGFHRIDLAGFNATLDLAVMDAADALAAWTGTADAWFLDGFAPARNPAMWSAPLLAAVAARSAPGARAATYTVAGAVRRGLAAAGFAVERKPGFGGKRERLEARLADEAAREAPDPRVAIIGAGIAGASLARAFTALGVGAAVFDAGGGASGNPAALVTPRLDAGLGPPAALFAQAFARARALYDTVPQAIIARGALQLEAALRDARRFAAVAASDLFEAGALTPLSAEETGAILGEAAPAALRIEAALVVEPAAVLAAWLGVASRAAKVGGLERAGNAWRLVGEDGGLLMEADIVCLAAGVGAAALAPELALLQPVRGQASWAAGPDLAIAAAFGAYAIPMRGGVLFGATHDRDEEAVDLRAQDDARNLEALARALPRLAARLGSVRLESRAGVRATTRDRLPIAGGLDRPGLFALTGLGSRGFVLAPLLAEHVAAQALGIPSPLPRSLQALVRPQRLAGKTAGPGRLGRAGANV